MKTVLAALAAVAAVTAAAAPAAAHENGRDHHRYDREWDGRQSINERQRELQRLMVLGERNGDLTRQESWVLRRELQEFARLEARFRAHGLGHRERAILDRRLDDLERSVILNLRDGQREYGRNHDRRDYGYGYGNWR